MEGQKHIEAYQELFDHMLDEHGVTLLQSDMDEIVSICDRLKIKYDKKKPFVLDDEMKRDGFYLDKNDED